jgi:YVTN family beta-propeller protein
MMLRSLLAATAAVSLIAGVALAAPSVEKFAKVPPGGLYELVYNPGDKLLYVAATGQRAANNAAVVKIDPVTLQEKGKIDVSANPVYGLGINSRTQTLYGTDTRGGTVIVFDLKTGKQTAVIKAPDGKPAHVREVVVDEATNKAYVSIVGGGERSAGADPASNQVWVIDGARNVVEKVISVPTQRLTGLAVDSAGKRIFVTGMGTHEVIAVSLTNDQVVGRWKSSGEGPINVAYDGAGKRLFVANFGSGDLSVMNADTGAVLSTVKTGGGALSVSYNPKLDLAYVTNRTGGTVTVVNGKDYSVAANLDAGTLPQTVVVDVDNGRAYATNKARGAPRQPPGSAPATPPAPPPEDPEGDTLTAIQP